MKKLRTLILGLAMFISVTHTATAAENKPSDRQALQVQSIKSDESVLVAMFKWLNEVYISDEDFTEEGFSQFFTDDILFIVNGVKRERGITALTQRYNSLKSRYAYLEILFPFREEERVGDKIFTYYMNRGWEDVENPVEITTHVMGYVEIEDEKISVLNFIFADLEPADQ